MPDKSNAFFALFFGLAFSLLVLPLAPVISFDGLDQGWVSLFHQAWQHNWQSGSDLIFTYGPLSPIYTRDYVPGLFGKKCLLILLFHLAAHQCVWQIAQPSRENAEPISTGFLPRVLLCLAFAYSYTLAPETYFSIAILAAGLVLLRPGTTLTACGASFVLVGASLIKGSLLVASLAFLAIACVHHWRRQALRQIGIIGASFGLLFLALWLALGQRPANIPAYIASIAEIAAGYNAAMGVAYKPAVQLTLEISSYVMACLLLLGALLRRQPPAILMFAVSLFIAYKSGFVRHDGHAVYSWSLLLLACLIALPTPGHSAPITAPGKDASLGIMAAQRLFAAGHSAPRLLVVLAATISTLGYGYAVTAYSDAANKGQQLIDQLSRHPLDNLRNLQTLRMLLSGNTSILDQQYQQQKEQVLAKHGRFAMQGAVDVYAYGQAYVHAAGHILAPRPVIQSYSAYTRKLAEINRQHLLDRGPPNILLGLETIDNRYPSLDDGASWPVLLQRYQLNDLAPQQHIAERYLHLQAVAPTPWLAPTPLASADGTLGQILNVPQHGQRLTYVKIHLQQSWLHRIIGLVYKPRPLLLFVTLADGSQHQHRLVAGAAEAGFVLSPYVANIPTLAALFYQDSGFMLDDLAVRQLMIKPEGNWLIDTWLPSFRIEYFSLPPGGRHGAAQSPILQHHRDLDRRFAPHPPEPDQPQLDLINTPLRAYRRQTESTLDQIQREGDIVTLTGWAELPDKAGERRIIISSVTQPQRVRQTVIERPDVVQVLNRPDLRRSGFRIELLFASAAQAAAFSANACVAAAENGNPPFWLRQKNPQCRDTPP